MNEELYLSNMKNKFKNHSQKGGIVELNANMPILAKCVGIFGHKALRNCCSDGLSICKPPSSGLKLKPCRCAAMTPSYSEVQRVIP